MHSPGELTLKFWHALSAHPIVMLGLDHEGGRSRPMTAQTEHGSSSLWFFSSKESSLVQGMKQGNHAAAAFAAKGHELFALVEGPLVLDDNPAALERLWNRFVAAWYEGGKQDPHLALLRLDAMDLQVWLNEASLLSGVRMLLGADPKKELAGSEARVKLS
jgi:general stress protein 26